MQGQRSDPVSSWAELSPWTEVYDHLSFSWELCQNSWFIYPPVNWLQISPTEIKHKIKWLLRTTIIVYLTLTFLLCPIWPHTCLSLCCWVVKAFKRVYMLKENNCPSPQVETSAMWILLSRVQLLENIYDSFNFVYTSITFF